MPQQNEPTFFEGCKGGIPIALGYVSVSFAFGMLAVKKGLPVWTPCLISFTNFTGTGQFAGVDLLTAGASLLEIAFTLLIINMRYFLMSFSLSQKLSPQVNFWQRLLIAFGNTDEIFAVSMRQPGLLCFRYMAGLILTSFAGWNFGTALGAFASTALPESVKSALGIALYAMFIAIIIPPLRDSKPVFQMIVLSVALSCLFRWTPGLNTISSGWVIILCGIVSAAFGAYFHPVQQEEADNGL